MMLVLLPLLACSDARQAIYKLEKVAEEAKEAASIPPMPCDAEVDKDPPNNCISGTLRCGDVVEGTTEGGDSEWSDEFYAGKFCFPSGNRYSGPERVYLFHAPENADIRIRLDSDCEDLDVAAIAWSYNGTCPTVNHQVPECTANADRGGGKIRINTFKARDYLVVVDGKDAATGTFRLTVDCGQLVR
jgi:hypothetical protein